MNKKKRIADLIVLIGYMILIVLCIVAVYCEAIKPSISVPKIVFQSIAGSLWGICAGEKFTSLLFSD